MSSSLLLLIIQIPTLILSFVLFIPLLKWQRDYSDKSRGRDNDTSKRKKRGERRRETNQQLGDKNNRIFYDNGHLVISITSAIAAVSFIVYIMGDILELELIFTIPIFMIYSIFMISIQITLIYFIIGLFVGDNNVWYSKSPQLYLATAILIIVLYLLFCQTILEEFGFLLIIAIVSLGKAFTDINEVRIRPTLIWVILLEALLLISIKLACNTYIRYALFIIFFLIYAFASLSFIPLSLDIALSTETKTA